MLSKQNEIVQHTDLSHGVIFRRNYILASWHKSIHFRSFTQKNTKKMSVAIGRVFQFANHRLMSQFGTSSLRGAPITAAHRLFCSEPVVASKEEIDKLVKNNKIVVFMKGVPDAPKCGFSNAVVQIMRMHSVPYDSHNVLENEAVRQGIKDYTNWPTIPQVFINGEFVGGCDIMLQMHQNGELIEELKKVGLTSALLKEGEQQNTTDNDKK